MVYELQYIKQTIVFRKSNTDTHTRKQREEKKKNRVKRSICQMRI